MVKGILFVVGISMLGTSVGACEPVDYKPTVCYVVINL